MSGELTRSNSSPSSQERTRSLATRSYYLNRRVYLIDRGYFDVQPAGWTKIVASGCCSVARIFFVAKTMKATSVKIYSYLYSPTIHTLTIAHNDQPRQIITTKTHSQPSMRFYSVAYDLFLMGW